MKTNLQTRVETSTRINGARRTIKMFGILMVAAMTTFTACTDYDNSLNNAEDRLDNVEQKIPTIGEQIESINNSIGDLNNLKESIKEARDKVDQLEGNTYNKTEIDNFKKDLEEADKTLNDRIDALQNYVNGNFKEGVEEWAKGTFATLEQYDEMQKTISEISTRIDTYKSEITEAYTKAIKDAIAASEESMKEWVNELLAEGYYNIADIDAKLSTLETTDASLQEQINAQQQALEQTKKDLTSAYQSAINEAIEANNGVIDQRVSAAIQEAINAVNTQITTINNTIANIQGEIENIKNSISSIEEQIESITGLIDELDNKLSNLETTDTDIINQINEQKQALEQLRTDLTSAYEEAIKRAIEENNGVINTEIAAAVQAAMDEVENRLNTLRGTIEDIEEELATLKENFASRIQSIRFLPEYSDGMVMFSTLETTAEISFIISPSNLAAVVANAHSEANHVVTAWISRTLSTRAVDMPVELTVTSVEGSESGLLTVGVDISSLAEGYWESFQSANMFIRIQDGNNDVISEMIPVSFDNE